MLKEEKELRTWASVIEYPEENRRDFYRDIRALVRAVREDCDYTIRQRCLNGVCGRVDDKRTWGVVCEDCENLLAAIRGKR